ncbi:MAG: hydrogenase maturation protease [Myxococcales bacterium]|nr:hydrogenase maturation protease [Myxococcales bacterium]
MKRVLVAGVGNVLFNDHGFGVEVARRLRTSALPSGAIVEDFGPRSVHRAFKLLGPLGIGQLVLVDSVTRGGEPGTVYLLDGQEELARAEDCHDLAARNPSGVYAVLRTMGDAAPSLRIVGCEPLETGPCVGLSAEVERAVEPAIRLVLLLIGESQRRSRPDGHATPSG